MVQDVFCQLGMVIRKNFTLTELDSSNTAVDVNRVDIFVGLLAFLPVVCIVAALVSIAVKVSYRCCRDMAAMRQNPQTTPGNSTDSETTPHSGGDGMGSRDSIWTDEVVMEETSL